MTVDLVSFATGGEGPDPATVERLGPSYFGTAAAGWWSGAGMLACAGLEQSGIAHSLRIEPHCSGRRWGFRVLLSIRGAGPAHQGRAADTRCRCESWRSLGAVETTNDWWELHRSNSASGWRPRRCWSPLLVHVLRFGSCIGSPGGHAEGDCSGVVSGEFKGQRSSGVGSLQVFEVSGTVG